MTAIEKVSSVLLENMKGRNTPKALRLEPHLWESLHAEQRPRCREHHFCDSLMSEHELRFHFLFMGIPMLYGEEAQSDEIIVEM